MDVLDTAFPDGAADCVVTVFLTDILPDPRALADEVHRILSEDGVWINYGPSGNNLNAPWRFDRTEGAAFFNAAGFEVIEAGDRRGTNLDITGVCPVGQLPQRRVLPDRGAQGGPAGDKAPRNTARTGRACVDRAATFPRRASHASAGNGASGQNSLSARTRTRTQRELAHWGQGRPRVDAVDGKRTVSDIAALLNRRQPPHPTEETLRVFVRFFEKGLLNWREDRRDRR